MLTFFASTPFYPQNFNVELVATWSDGDSNTAGTDVAITPDGWVYVLTGDFGNGTGHTIYILDGRDLPDSGLKFVDSVRSIYSLSAMTLWKDYLYVHDYGGGGILVYDISDRANPRFIRRVVPPGKEGKGGEKGIGTRRLTLLFLPEDTLLINQYGTIWSLERPDSPAFVVSLDFPYISNRYLAFWYPYLYAIHGNARDIY